MMMDFANDPMGILVVLTCMQAIIICVSSQNWGAESCQRRAAFWFVSFRAAFGNFARLVPKPIILPGRNGSQQFGTGFYLSLFGQDLQHNVL
jgi:hypothetical protein